MATISDIARLIYEHLTPANPIVPGVIVADGGLNADTPVVSVQVGDARRQAVYLPPHAIVADGKVFVARQGPGLDAPLVVLATNYQGVATVGDGDWGSGSRAWGTGGGLWGV